MVDALCTLLRSQALINYIKYHLMRKFKIENELVTSTVLIYRCLAVANLVRLNEPTLFFLELGTFICVSDVREIQEFCVGFTHDYPKWPATLLEIISIDFVCLFVCLSTFLS